MIATAGTVAIMINVSKTEFLRRIPISTSVLTTKTKHIKTMENNTKREPLRLVNGKFMRGGELGNRIHTYLCMILSW